MHISMTTVVPSKELLRGWERVLLVLPTLAGLFFGILPLLLPAWFASLVQFPAKNFYIYQLAGAATLGYGVTLAVGLCQQAWLPLRLPLIGVLVFNLASLYACAATIAEGQTPPSVFLVLASSILFVIIACTLLLRHRGVPRPDLLRAHGLLRVLLVVGGISAAIFGLGPLLLPGASVPLFHFQAGTDAIARQAGAACLGYAVLSLLVQQGLDRRELALTAVMAGIFNGASGIMSIPVLISGNVFLLPWIIVPVGLSALFVSVLILRSAFMYRTSARSDR